MKNKIFVDTDVIIDFLTDRQPFANFSSLIFELHEKGTIQIYISALCVNNIYYISRRILGEKKALLYIDKLIDNIEIVSTSKKDIKKAFQTGFKDFEDSLQYATAQTISGIESIITRNVKDYKNSKIAVFTPEIYIKSKNTKSH